MKESKKGYTLVELITVIVIVGILALLVVPIITKYISSGKEKYYGALESDVSIMAKDYFTDNKVELPRGQLDEEGNPIYQKKITTAYLQENNFVTNEIVDSEGGSCDESYVIVRNENGKINYHTCLVCDNYRTTNEFCDGTDDGSLPVCTVSLKKNGSEYDGEWTKDDVVASIIGNDNDGISMFKVGNARIEATKDGTSYKGEYKITDNGEKTYRFTAVDMSSNTGICAGDNNRVVKIDKQGPKCENTNVTLSGWQGKKTISFEVTDSGSGVATVKLGDNALAISADGKVSHEVKENGNYAFIMTDNLGNNATCNVKVSQVDNTPPVISLPKDEDIFRVNQDASLTVPIIVIEKESGLDIESFTKEDIVIKVDGKEINPGKELRYINENNGEYRYELTINSAIKDGNLSLIIDDNKVFDKASNPNKKVTLDSSYKVDNTKPSDIKYVAYYSNDGTVYNGEWTNKEVYTNISAYDIGEVVEFSYSKDKNDWTKFNFAKSDGIIRNGHNYSGEEVWTLKNRNDTYYFRAKDKAGNISELSREFTVRYDIDKPVCNFTTVPTYVGKDKSAKVIVKCNDAYSGLVDKNLGVSDFTLSSTKATITDVESKKIDDKNYEYSLTIKGVDAGTVKISINAGVISDKAGNVNDSTTNANDITISTITAAPSEVTLDLRLGNTKQIAVGGSNYGTASFTSANPSIASVSSTGLITPKARGTTIITVTGSNGGPTATVKVKVIATYVISYNSKGGLGTMSSHTVTYGSAGAISSNSFTKKGYNFAGWTTNSNGTNDGYNWTGWSGTWVYDNGQYGISGYKLQLYARWSPKTYTISYNSKGGSGTVSSHTVTYGSAYEIKSNSFTKKGYNFAGWTTNSNGTDDGHRWTNSASTWTYDNGEYGISGNKLQLYARWSPKTYTISYNSNGGSGTMSSQTVTYGGTITIRSNSFSRDGYTFAGWTTNSNGTNDGYNWTGFSGTWVYDNGQYGISGNNLLLYARWTASFALTCPSSAYVWDIVTCTTNQVGVTLTCSGVSLSSSYNTSFITTASDMTKQCQPTSSGTLKVTATKGGATTSRDITIDPYSGGGGGGGSVSAHYCILEGSGSDTGTANWNNCYDTTLSSCSGITIYSSAKACMSGGVMPGERCYTSCG